MNLTQKEQDMLAGKYGEGVQLAMEVLVKMGELYKAERFLPVKNAHIDAAAYTTIWNAGTEFVEYLVDHGAKVAVPTTINALSRDICNWEKLGISEEFAKKSERLENAYIKLGVIPTWSCAPYHTVNAPQFRENVSWSESNAVGYVNSVVGARTERLPDLVDVCCAVAGRVPEYGLYLDENRKGGMLFRLEGFDETWFQDSVDYSVLGYYIGEIVVNKVPVIENLPEHTMQNDLKAFSAAAAAGGAVGLFHAVGFTPEARTIEEAFQGDKEYETRIVTPDDLIKMKRKLNTAKGDHADMVFIGCPHAAFEDLRKASEYIKGKKVAKGTTFFIQTSDTHYRLACRCGVAEILEEAGVTVAIDTCLMEMDEKHEWKGKTFVTNSGKGAQYAPAINGVDIVITSIEGCVEAAVTGKLPKEV